MRTLLVLVSALFLLGCPAKPADPPKSGTTDAPRAAPVDQSDPLLRGAPLTPAGAIDQEALKQFAFLPALQARAWDGSNYQPGSEIPLDPAWDTTPPFDELAPIPEAVIQPDPYILPLPTPPGADADATAGTAEKEVERSAEEIADAEGEARKQAESGDSKIGGRQEPAKARREPQRAPPPGPADWAPMPIPAGHLEVAFQAFTYEAEGLTLTGYSAMPQNAGTTPVVILLHGLVPPERYNVGTHAREAKYLASRGYTVLVPNFRNYGASSRDDSSPELVRLGTLRDAVNLVQVVRLGRIPNTDPNRIAVFGFGHGGSLAMKTAILTRPAAVFVVSPTGQQESDDQELFARAMAPNIGEAMEKLYGKADNPQTIGWYRSMTYTNFVKDLGCPVGIVAGELNPLVPIDHVRGMMAVLTPVGLQCMMSTFPRTGHTFHGQDWLGLMLAAEQFLRQPLQVTPPPA